jgi:DNA-binding Xre family transcriptional regulator
VLVRIRIPELLKEQKPPMSAYKLAKASDGRISMSAAYRLTAAEGRLQFFDADLLEALCDVLGIGPDKLLERGSKKRARS